MLYFRLFFYFILVFSFSFSAGPSCSCNGYWSSAVTNTYKNDYDIASAYVHTDGSYEPYPPNFYAVDVEYYCYENDVAETVSYTYSNERDVIVGDTRLHRVDEKKTLTDYTCKICNEPDLPAVSSPPSDGHVWSLISSWSCYEEAPSRDNNLTYYQTSTGSACCPLSSLYLGCNQGQKGQSDPTKSKYGQCITDPDYTPPGTDTDGDGIPDNQDPDIDNDGIPNDDDDTPYGDGGNAGSCGDNQHISGTDGPCVCNDGYINNSLSSTALNCVLDSNVPQCPSINEGKPLQQSNVTNASCLAMIDSNINNGGTGGNYLPLPAPAINGCCYYSPTDLNNGDNPSDPCYYDSFKSGFPLKETTYSQSLCVDKWNFYNAGLGAYAKNNDCAYGACYYGYSDTPPTDGNNTSSSNNTNSNTDRTINAIDQATGQQTQQIINSNTNLGQKIDDIGKSEDGTYGSDFVAGDANSSSFIINGDRVKKINDDVTVIYSNLDNATSLFQSALDQFSIFSDNVSNSFNSLTTDFDSYKTMFSNSPTTVIQSSGTCNGLTFSVFGKTIHLDAGMCSAFQILAPYVNFILIVLTQFLLIYLSIKLLSRSS